ncbi:response regulator [Fournierella sp.]|uniref:LytR/AlgR family response regulator transcription factor n=1 Tax=Allofournierella sp. TaxID=1940256 RepID=UPI00307918ED
MLHIAIVDDEQKQRDLLCGYLERYRQKSGRQLRVTAFADAETFLQGYQPDFDIIFMDIQLPDRDGMTLSKKLRETNRTVILIFVTNMVQMAVEGYSVDAMDFIVKPVNYYRMAAALDKACLQLEQKQGVTLTIRTKNGLYCIDSSQLCYVEMQAHHRRVRRGGQPEKAGAAAGGPGVCPVQQWLSGGAAVCAGGDRGDRGGERRAAAYQPHPAQGVSASAFRLSGKGWLKCMLP